MAERVLGLLLDRGGREVQITESVLKAALTGSFEPGRVLALLIKRNGNEIQITRRVADLLLNDSGDLEKISLHRNGKKVLFTAGGFAEAARRFRSELVALVLHGRVDVDVMRRGIAILAMSSDRTAMRHQLDDLDIQDAGVLVTEEAIPAAAGNPYDGAGVMKLLLARTQNDAVAERVLVAAARNEEYGTGVVKEIARNRWSGFGLMKLLLNYGRSETRITEEVVIAAAGNTGCEVKLMQLLLELEESAIEITDRVIETAPGNTWGRPGVIKLLLDRKESIVQITEGGMIQIARLFGSMIEKFLVQTAWGPEEAVQRTISLGKMVVGLALNSRRNEIRVTGEVVKAASANKDTGKKVMGLLLSQRGVKLEITARVVSEAAKNKQVSAGLMEYLKKRVNEGI
ncbi:Fc.00g047970.m01.CDS01 [Cosmosporella sp. VM-42]